MVTAQFDKTTCTVAAWNLNGFNGVDVGRMRRQAVGIRLLDAEVVTLVEIPSEQHLVDFVEEIAANDRGPQYTPIFLPQNGDLHVGVLVKPGVTHGVPSLLVDSDGGNPDNRRALVVPEVRVGRFDFTLMGVHLKSGRAGQERLIRDRQCQAIGREIIRMRGAGDRNPDILLMGDFNMIPGQDTSNFHHLSGDNTMDFVSSWDLQERFSHILEAGRANLLDGFAVSRRFSTEYIRGSLRLFPMHWNMDIGLERYRATVSDHLPFVASFKLDDLD